MLLCIFKGFTMKRFSIFIIFITLLISCNDGEIIVKDFNFDNVPLQRCGSIENYVFYKENPESFETLSLRLGISDSIYKEPGIRQYPLGDSNFVNYRRHDGKIGQDYFCSSIPPSEPQVLEDYKAVSGIAELIISFEYDDENPEPKHHQRPSQVILRKHLQIFLKDIVLIKGKEQIILESIDMGKIENVEIIEL